MNYSKLLEVVKDHVLKWFQLHDAPQLYYHNLTHTQEVAKAVRKMSDYYKLNERDDFIVEAAAWFHDIAYPEGSVGHELRGAQKAEAFLKEQETDEPTIYAVKECILATRLPQNPTGLLQEIVCDADLFDLGTDEFAPKSKLLRKEQKAGSNKKITKTQSRMDTLQLLQSHHFFTEYCRRHLSNKEQEHVEQLKNKIRDTQQNASPAIRDAETGTDKKGQGTDGKKNKKREHDLLFRISSTNNLRLSEMADSKAHIMITVNAIIVSVLLSVLVRNMDNYKNLTIPVILLLLINLITIFFSMLATKPYLPKGRFTQSDMDEKKINLLFFGNYYRMDFEEYSDAMTKVMDDEVFLDLSLKRDIYQQGIVLSKKYRMLKVAYSVFMYGLIVSVVVFFIAARFIKG